MTADPLRAEEGPLSRVYPRVPFRAIGLSILLGMMGVAQVAGTFLAYNSRLPPLIPDHFGPTGEVNGWASATTVLEVSVGLVVAVTILFAGLLLFAGRSAPLSVHHRGKMIRPLLAIEGVLVLVSIPGATLILVAGAAGTPPISAGLEGLLLLLLGLAPVCAAIAWLFLVRARWNPHVASGSGTAGAVRASARVSGPVELECSSCGQVFRLAGVPLLAPHLGSAEGGSLYLRCLWCGERGWNRLVRRLDSA